ncbi:type I-E CRISPR-associated endoribonuclease Cas2 [Sorangium sp. So ce1504]
MLKVRAGVFAGTLSARVRELLWQAVCARNESGGCVLVHAAQNE